MTKKSREGLLARFKELVGEASVLSRKQQEAAQRFSLALERMEGVPKIAAELEEIGARIAAIGVERIAVFEALQVEWEKDGILGPPEVE